MKQIFTVLAFSLVMAAALAFSSYSGDECDYPSGSPAGYTGSPGDGKECTQCHGGTAAPVTGWITSDIPATGYVPGNTYNVTVTVTGSGKKGFEVSPQSPSGAQLGTLIAGSGSHLTGGTKYVTQNSGVTSNPATWTFQWTAPVTGTGEVTFYGAFCVGEPVTKTSTLTVQETTLLPLTVTASADPQTLVHGDSTRLDCTPEGGTGTYSYTWNSIPAGFVSNEKSPWAKPDVNTDYVVIVSDGSGTALDTVSVTVTPGVGIALPEGRTTLKATPNPSRGVFALEIPEAWKGVASVQVFSAAGTQAGHYEITGNKGQLTLDLTGKPDGIYFVSIRIQEAEYYVKIIKSAR